MGIATRHHALAAIVGITAALGGAGAAAAPARALQSGAGLTVSGAVTLISTSSAGVKGGSITDPPSLSGSGKLAAFDTLSSLDAGDTNSQYDVYVKDLGSGVLTLASTSAAGKTGNGPSRIPVMSADGGWVAFQSGATNLDPGDEDIGFDVYVKDLATGDITLASTSTGGVKGDFNSGLFQLGLSRNGTFVVFQSNSDNLDPLDGDVISDVYRKNVKTGVLKLVSTSTAGVKASGDSLNPAVSDDGRAVAFQSSASNLDPADTDGGYDIYVKDLSTGRLTLASASTAGVDGNGDSQVPSISGGGKKVAFASTATNLDPADTDATSDIYVKNLVTGDLTLVSTADDGTKANGLSWNPHISGDGTRVAFESQATNLDPADTDPGYDVYVKNLVTGDIALVSATPNGVKGDGASELGSLSGAGKSVGFETESTNLDPGDTEQVSDDYVKQPVVCTVAGTSGADTLQGTAGDDVLCGRGGRDTLIGKGGNDILFGEDGADSLQGGGGEDLLLGGSGKDTADYSTSALGVTVDLSTSTATGGDATGDALDSIESVTGSDDLDFLTGTSGANVLKGRDGDDILAGGGGGDVLNGGSGLDLIDYRSSPAAITVDLGAGAVSGGDADGDTIAGVEGAIGTPFPDSLTGDGGDNVFRGMAGGDTIDGGAGSDQANYVLSPAAVTIDLLAGTASGGDAAGDVLTGIENLSGSVFDDTLTGDDGPNTLAGNNGDDTLSGKLGKDTLIGGPGTDTFDGGGATDTCDNVSGESASSCEL